MSEIPERIIRNDDGTPVFESEYLLMRRRVMTAEEIVERNQLNIENTAQAIYEKARTIRSQSNGHENRNSRA